MAQQLRESFANKKGRPVFVTYLTAGFPSLNDTVENMLQLQNGGADIIELGVPFSDPIADGPTIQEASHLALQNGVDLRMCLEFVKDARKSGLTVPVVLMGYYNPFLMFPETDLMKEAKAAGVNGFIIVDLPPEEALHFRDLAKTQGLSYIPLIAPSTSLSRMAQLVQVADSFIYVVSTLGVTGARTSINKDLPEFVAKIKQLTTVPLAVGFGVSNREQFLEIGRHAQGVVIGSKIISVLKEAGPGTCSLKVKEFVQSIVQGPEAALAPVESKQVVSEKTRGHDHSLPLRFGNFGGQYAPEALVDCLDEIETAFHFALNDPTFWEEFRSHYSFMGRPSKLHVADRLTAECGGATIWLKREDLNHTGSHKINNALGQVLLAKRLGKTRIIAETGAGQHGVATATACAKFGLECIIYMGSEDVRRQALNVFRIKLLGAKVIPVESGSRTLKDAINEAMRDWVTNVSTTHYLIGSAIGPHPFPTIVREFQSVIGKETRGQLLKEIGKLPDAVIACVGGGSNAIGMFAPFINDAGVRLIGVEAAGDGVDTDHHSATLSRGTPGVLHGTKTYLIQDKNGQIQETHSISAGLDYPGVGPEHAHLFESKRAEYLWATDEQSLIGFRKLSETEGIIPALETAHAVFVTMKVASTMSKDQNIVLCVSGRGDKDVGSVAEALPKFGPRIGWDLRFQEKL